MPSNSTHEILELLSKSRNDLLDLSFRNPLLNFRLTKARGVQIVDERSSEVYKLLVDDGRKMVFSPCDEDEEQTSLLPNNGLDETKTDIARLTDRFLQTPHDNARLEKRLLGTHYNARTYIEERGVSILFLALGMLHWYDDESSDQKLRAPLVLVPVELSRTDAREKFVLQYVGGDIGSNVSLCHKLRERAIKFPEIDDASDLNLVKYFAMVEKSVRGQSRWRVERDDMVLGFFAFGKFLMYHDLNPDSWPESNSPAQHPILRALLVEGFESSENVVEQGSDLDKLVFPQDTFHVVDADSSQIAAALEVRSGSSIVIQGPPGTGKSQTITNIIAQAIGDGKRVLFVAEKMAALEVVKRRLDSIGLGDACLELHSHKANKKAVLEELEKTHKLTRPQSRKNHGDFAAYIKLRQELNAYCDALHSPVKDTGFAPYEIIGRLTRLQRVLSGVSLPELPREEIERQTDGQWSRDDLPTWESVILNMEAHIASVGRPIENSFYGSGLRVVLPSDLDRIKSALGEALSAATELNEVFSNMLESMDMMLDRTNDGLSCLRRVAERVVDAPEYCRIDYLTSDWIDSQGTIEEVIKQGNLYRSIHDQFDADLVKEVWGEDVSGVRATLSRYGAKWWRFMVRDFWAARKQLFSWFENPPPKEHDDRLKALDAISSAAEYKKHLIEQSDLCSSLFGDLWRREHSQWETLTKVLQWVAELHEDVRSGLLPDRILVFLRTAKQTDDVASLLPPLIENTRKYDTTRGTVGNLVDMVGFGDRSYCLDSQIAQLQAMIDECDSLQDHVGYNILRDELNDLGLQWLADITPDWNHASEHLVDLFWFIWLESLYRIVLKKRPALAQFSAATHQNKVIQFGQLDSRLLEYNRVRLALNHYESLPANTSNGQIGVLLREFNKRRRHLPIRQLIQRGGHAIQALKPVFMMSPMSIASFLSRDSVTFDLVVFDEASQVRPVDAFGAVLRGRQIVVVGDDKQLPPTTFFDCLASGDDIDEDIDLPSDMESILGLMCTRGGPQSMLVWHYRSEHESLIATSNSEFYDNKLVVFPSTGDPDAQVGLFFHHLPNAIYDRGKSRTNLDEARAVAHAVLEHARSSPGRSLGVAAFSAAQAEAIINELERLRKTEGHAEPFFRIDGPEPFFVKNLESVQGDERDVIFISIGYGRSEPGGLLSMNFGALNNSGGERRLNVLITRARARCEVFSSITHEDIDLSRSASIGVRALKTFLQYAQTGDLEVPIPAGESADSTFEEEVGRAIEREGYEIERQVGSAGYRIDLAVKDATRPGRFLLAIECDGATYHRSRTARDRDRLRQLVLETRGWKFHRIWSTDWFRSRERALKRAIEAIERAKTHDNPGVDIDGRLRVPTHTVISRSKKNRHTSSPQARKDYEVARLGHPCSNIDFAYLSDYKLSDLVIMVIKTEGPIHIDLVKRRIADACGIKRMGSRIDERIDTAIWQGGIAAIDVRREGEFLWWKSRRRITPRCRSNLPVQERSLKYIAPRERWSAVLAVVKESHGIREEHTPAAVLRLFGFMSSQANQKVIIEDIKELIQREHLERKLEQLFITRVKDRALP